MATGRAFAGLLSRGRLRGMIGIFGSVLDGVQDMALKMNGRIKVVDIDWVQGCGSC